MEMRSGPIIAFTRVLTPRFVCVCVCVYGDALRPALDFPRIAFTHFITPRLVRVCGGGGRGVASVTV